jgi:hypothetical protein
VFGTAALSKQPPPRLRPEDGPNEAGGAAVLEVEGGIEQDQGGNEVGPFERERKSDHRAPAIADQNGRCGVQRLDQRFGVGTVLVPVAWRSLEAP